MNPFLSIWKAPKATVKYLIEHKTIGYGLIIMMIASLGPGIMTFADTFFLEGFSLPAILAISIGAALILSIPGYFISAFAYTWIGKLLGGTGNWREMCLVIAGGGLLMIWTLPISILAVILYGKTLFTYPEDIFAVTNMSPGFYFLYTVILMGLSIFGIVVQSKGIGLVHNISALRGFGTILIYAGFVFVLVFTIAVAVAVMSGILFMG